jgi:DNA-binding transcriptional LysR family regulator
MWDMPSGPTSEKSIDSIADIRLVSFQNLDLNLLRVLDAKLCERNTTRVSQKLKLSQPAVSAGLSHLRRALGNPLLVLLVARRPIRHGVCSSAKLRRSRNVALGVPKFYGVARSIAQTNLISVLPSRFATALAERFGIACRRVPHELTLARQFLYVTLRRRIIAGCGSRSSALEPLDEFSPPAPRGRQGKTTASHARS